MRCVVVFHADLQRRICSATDVSNICRAGKDARPIPFAGSLSRVSNGDGGILNVQSAGHIIRFLGNAHYLGVERTRAFDGQIVGRYLFDGVCRSFRHLQHHFHRAVFNLNSAV